MTEFMISTLIAIAAIFAGFFLMVCISRIWRWAELMKPYHIHAYNLQNDFTEKSFWLRHTAAKEFAQFLNNPTLRNQTFVDASFRAKSATGVDEYDLFSISHENTPMARRLKNAYDDMRMGKLIEKHGFCDRT